MARPDRFCGCKHLPLPANGLLQAWRVYQRGIERWLADMLQPLFDMLVAEKMVPSFVQVGQVLCCWLGAGIFEFCPGWGCSLNQSHPVASIRSGVACRCC